jgi:xanthine dehydrogenase/oxidase
MIVSEAVMDHLARELGMGALEFRERNLYQEGQRTHYGQELVRWNVPRAMSEVRASGAFEERRAAAEAFNAQNRWRKRGVFIMPTKFGINFTAKFMNQVSERSVSPVIGAVRRAAGLTRRCDVQGGALVHVYMDGSVLVSHGGTEMGQGLHTKVMQIAARAFGIPQERVHIAETCTDKVANSSPTAASASTDLYGMATLDACEQIKVRLLTPRRATPRKDCGFHPSVEGADDGVVGRLVWRPSRRPCRGRSGRPSSPRRTSSG